MSSTRLVSLSINMLKIHLPRKGTEYKYSVRNNVKMNNNNEVIEC